MNFIIVWLLGIVLFFVILYFVVNAAVRNAIIEALHPDEKANAQNKSGGENISQTTCPKCGKRYDMDYPKCPFCKN